MAQANMNPRKNVNFTKAERDMLKYVDAKTNFSDYVKGLIAEDMAPKEPEVIEPSREVKVKKRYIARNPAPPTILVPIKPSLKYRVN